MLVDLGLAEAKLSLTTEQRNEVLQAWNAVEEHDKQPQKFNQLYWTHWDNTLYCRKKKGMILLMLSSSRSSRWLSAMRQLNETSVLSTTG